MRFVMLSAESLGDGLPKMYSDGRGWVCDNVKIGSGSF